MSFGIPYTGSKNLLAKQICDVLPSGKRLVDLFAGGCAVTDCAIRCFAYKWDTFLINDLNRDPIDLYAKCLCGENPVSYDWVSHDDFKKKDWATRLVWSFSNNTINYLYSRKVEPLKHDIEHWVVTGTVIHDSGIFDGMELPILSTLQERHEWWKKIGKKLIKERESSGYGRFNLKRLELERLERLERLEFSYLSYEQYEYRDGDIVYCDIPYLDTRCTHYKKTDFNHSKFWEWTKSRPYDVYVSERIIPNDVNAEIVMECKLANRCCRADREKQNVEYIVRI